MRWSILWGGLVVGVLGSGCDKRPPPPSASEQAELDELLAKGETEAEKRTARWREAISVARDDVVPRPDLGKCPVDVGDPLFAMTNELLGGMGDLIDSEYSDPIAMYDAPALATSPSPRSRMVVSQLKVLARPKSESRKTAQQRLEAARKLVSGDWTWDLVIVIDQKYEPSSFDLEENTFEGGMAAGFAYVFDYQKNQVVCAGRFLAQSSERLSAKDEGEAKAAADVDFKKQIAKGAIENLSVAGPRAQGTSPAVSASAAASAAP